MVANLCKCKMKTPVSPHWLHSAWTLRKINFSHPLSSASFQFFMVSNLMTQQTNHHLDVKTDALKNLHFISFTFEYLHHLLPGDKAKFEFHFYHVHYLLLKMSAGYKNKKKKKKLSPRGTKANFITTHEVKRDIRQPAATRGSRLHQSEKASLLVPNAHVCPALVLRDRIQMQHLYHLPSAAKQLEQH